MGCNPSKSKHFHPDGPDEIQRRFLDEHNEIRRQHKVPLLRWCPELSIEATRWAFHMADKRVIEHNSDAQSRLYGSTVYKGWSNVISDLERNFTQIVWRETEELGIGYKWVNQNELYLCAYYFPQGNVVNRFKENVFRPSRNKSLKYSDIFD